jgi:hypothetical protein
VFAAFRWLTVPRRRAPPGKITASVTARVSRSP